IRDSGLVHALLHIKTMDDLLGHPVIGQSFEGFIIENILNNLPSNMQAYFYRTSAGAEIDLVLERNFKERIAIEIKRSLSPTVSKGFYIGMQDIGAKKGFIIYPGI